MRKITRPANFPRMNTNLPSRARQQAVTNIFPRSLSSEKRTVAERRQHEAYQENRQGQRSQPRASLADLARIVNRRMPPREDEQHDRPHQPAIPEKHTRG